MSELLTVALRVLGAGDIDAVLRIQAQCYGADFVEPREVFARRLQGTGHCSWAAVQGGEVLAYLAAYWSCPGVITPLNGDFAEYSDARARGVQRTALVSVQGSQHYWERQGYKVEPVTNAAQQQHLASYGEGALYMVGFI